MVDFSKYLTLLIQACGNWREVGLNALIIVCSVITLLGSLKAIPKIKAFKDKYNLAFKVIFGLGSLALVLPAVALCLLIGGYSFDLYWYCVYPLFICVPVVYFLYENTGLRALVNKVGSFCFRKLFVSFCASVVDSDNAATREKLVAANKEIKDYTSKAVKSVLVSKNKEVDKDLESL